jgi:hypothetical protein
MFLSEAPGTLKRLESGEKELGGRQDTVAAIYRALVAGGVIFIPENGGGAGVRLKGGRRKD